MKKRIIEIKKVSTQISIITLKRAEKHNALNLDMIEELCTALEKLENSDSRVVILEAEGTTFCSGLDLFEASEDSTSEKMAVQLASLFNILHSTSLVTIAAIQGNAMGGGGGLAASCDIVLIAEEARIGFPETSRGLVAAQVATILVRQMCMRHVRELLLTGELVSSQRSVEIGLANHVVKLKDLDSEALKLAEKVLKGAPGAVKETKRLLDKLISGDFSKDLQLALAVHHVAKTSQEGKEGIASFLDKRPPAWNP